MSSERNFQQYLMKQVPHGYRTSLVSGGGFPDVLLIHGERHSLVELKLLEVGPSGNKKIAPLFKPTQPPWYLNYLAKGGKRLYVVFKLNKGYGLLHVDRDFVMALGMLYYSDLPKYRYKEYDVLKELLDENFLV